MVEGVVVILCSKSPSTAIGRRVESYILTSGRNLCAWKVVAGVN